MVEKEKGFNPTFENGGYWEYYKDLEHQFESFLNLVPYLKKNEKAYSFRLANLILGIGAHVDSAFKEIFKWSVFSSKYADILRRVNSGKANMTDYRKLEPEYNLSKRKVVFKCLPDRETVIPFRRFDTESPKWWRDYNKIKHEFSLSFYKANLKNARDSLAGAFLLNVIHEPASLRLFNYGLLKPKYQPRTIWATTYDTFKGHKMSTEHPKGKQVEDAFTVETSLFIYDFEKVEDCGA
jgi:hypothetical protein